LAVSEAVLTKFQGRIRDSVAHEVRLLRVC